MLSSPTLVEFHESPFTSKTATMQTARLKGTSYKLPSTNPDSTAVNPADELQPGEFRRVRRKARGKKKIISPSKVASREKLDEMSGVMPFVFQPPPPEPSATNNKQKKNTVVGVDGMFCLLCWWCAVLIQIKMQA
jgi:hypothetical protein